jgi:hypothetical protein
VEKEGTCKITEASGVSDVAGNVRPFPFPSMASGKPVKD